MWNIRMRASKKDIHISGAEGIFSKSDIKRICSSYIERAFSHPRGTPDKITLSIEELRQKAKTVSLLQVNTLKCKVPDEAEKSIIKKLSELGISNKAINAGLKILRSKKTMRGAGLIRMKSGTRAEPDKIRGVRVSRFGIKKLSEKKLEGRLAKKLINTITVKEALILASKSAYAKDIIAEVCISDDPDYTTGYIASRKFGYLRILNIKKRGHMQGGRALFIKEDTDIKKLIQYLEKTPVMLEY